MLGDWQEYEDTPAEMQATRERIKPIHPHAKMRALNKLGKQTKVRKNPKTGEREFLLHRAASIAEASSVINNDKISHKNRSSWTPDYDAAEHLSSPDVQREFGQKGRTSILSAWIPESKIVHVPYIYGGSESLKSEYEIIVDPHESDRAQFSKQPPSLHERISRAVPRSFPTKLAAREFWLYENKAALESVRRGLAQSARAKPALADRSPNTPTIRTNTKNCKKRAEHQ